MKAQQRHPIVTLPAVFLLIFLASCTPFESSPDTTPTSSPLPTTTPIPPPTSTPTIAPTPPGGGSGKFIFQYFKEDYEKEFPGLKGGSNLFTANWDGSELSPVTDGLPDGSDFWGVSPDGRKALLMSIPPNYTTSERKNVLFVVDLLDRQAPPVKLAIGIWENIYKTAAWAGNSRIVYIDQVPGGWAIFTINSDGTGAARISQRVKGITPRDIFVTADLSRVFWQGVDDNWKPRGYWWTSLDGTQQAQLMAFDPQTDLANVMDGISPDGTMIVWEHNTWSRTGGCCSIRFALTSAMDAFTEIKLEPRTGILIGPSPEYIWSPDGSQVLINRQAELNKSNGQVYDPGQMFSLSPANMTLKLLVLKPSDTTIQYPTVDILQWLPDGKSLLVRVTSADSCGYFNSGVFCSGGKLKILDLETGTFTALFDSRINSDRILKIFGLPGLQ